MLTSYADQINAIQHARAFFKKNSSVDLDAALNDAANTINAVRLNEHVDKKEESDVEVAMKISMGIFYELEKLYS